MSHRLDRAVRNLTPSAWAFVMATAIVSAAEAMFGRSVTSNVLFAVALAGYVLITAGFLLRVARHANEVWHDTGLPQRAFGFFTFAAATNVLGFRFSLAGEWKLGAAFGVAGSIVWAALSYGILARVALRRIKPSPGDAVDGGWLNWVVATQSVSIAAVTSGFAIGMSGQVLALVATTLWSVGAVLYVVLLSIVLARLILVPVERSHATAPYWIAMGATAITVLSGAHVLRLAPSLPAVEAVRPALEGLTFFLWAFGTWWFPFLFVLTAWRYAAPRGRAFDSSLWSMVFPLGMYGVATDTFGDAAHLPLLRSLASAEVWLALIAWAGVAAWMVASTRGGRGERSGDAARRAPA